MNVYEPQVLYITSHGHYEIRTGSDCSGTTIPQVSQFMLKDAIVYAYRPEDGMGNYYPEYKESGEVAEGYQNLLWGKKYAQYAQDLYLYYYSALKLVFMDTCLCGRIGSGYGDTRQQGNPYQIVSGNDFAYIFGIYDNMYTNGASYCAFYELSFDDDRYSHFIERVFGSLRNGYSLDQAITRDAWGDSYCTGSYPGGIDEEYGPSQHMDVADDPAFSGLIDNFCFNWRVPMPPYHNLRVQGNPIAMRLNPY